MTGRPRSAADDVLDLLDQALAEPSHLEVPVYDKADTCARCGAPATDERCGGCRAFLLGDTTTDPAIRPPAPETRTPRSDVWPTGLPEPEIRRRCERCGCPDCQRWLANHPPDPLGALPDDLRDQLSEAIRSEVMASALMAWQHRHPAPPPPPVEHVGYRQAMATAAAYPTEPPADPAFGTEVLFVAAEGVHRRWWGPDPMPWPPPGRYLLPVFNDIDGLGTHQYELAGAMWRDDGRRRLVYKRTH